jgi:hypothetical protein
MGNPGAGHRRTARGGPLQFSGRIGRHASPAARIKQARPFRHVTRRPIAASPIAAYMCGMANPSPSAEAAGSAREAAKTAIEATATVHEATAAVEAGEAIAEIYHRIDRELAVEEARADRLLAQRAAR